MPLLNDMALFVEVVKAKSFRGAAETLGMPNSTLSNRISALEKAIGLRLLNRTTRRIEPTEAGQIYFERSKRIVEEARLAHEQLGDLLAQPSGVVRVSLPVDFASTFLAPRMPEFVRRFPGIGFDFDLTPRRVDLVAEPFDVAIRMGELSDSNLIARQLAMIPIHLYASPRYLELHGEPAHPSDLSGHECLRMRTASETWALHDHEQTVVVPVGGRFLLNNVGMLGRLAIFDLGIAMLADEIAARDVADGKLRRVLPGWHCPPLPVWAVTETRLLPAKTQRFIEFLKESLS